VSLTPPQNFLTFTYSSSIRKRQTRPIVREDAKQDRNCQRVKISGHEPHVDLDTKTDRQSQCDSDFDV
jgi:hypothetical protein